MKQLRIGDRLVQSGTISEAQRDFALIEQKRTGERLGAIIRRLNLVSEEELARILAATTGVEYVQLRFESIDPSMTSALPEWFVRRHKVFPTAVDEHSISVAMPDPLDIATIDRVEQQTGRYVRVQCCSEFDVLTAIDRFYGPDSTSGIEELIADALHEVETNARTRDGISPSGVTKLVDHLLLTAIRERASDIHFEPERDVLRVRYRVDGMLHQSDYVPKTLEPAIVSCLKVMASIETSEQRLPQDGKATIHVYGRDVDLRVSTFTTLHGENVVLRVLHRNQLSLGLENLGLSGKNLYRLRQTLEQPSGVVLVTGPSGSGRTTTLYGALMTLNTAERKIITLEDPVEYELPFIRQSQIDVRAGLTYASGLRAILRQDPDVILIGEMRDQETLDTAFRSALTGLLVFSTLHTNDAVSSIPRLLEMGVEPYLAASALSAIVSQRLLRMICKFCKVDSGVPQDLVRSLGAPENGAFYKGSGCRNCEGTGYKGRTLVSEVMLMSPRIRKAITEGSDAAALRRIALEEGMETMLTNGIQKALAGITTVEEVARVV